MRRLVFVSLGVLEFLAAGVLLAFAAQLPGPAEVEESVGRVERVGKQASAQVGKLGTQMRQVRKRQPQLRTLAVRLEKQMRQVSEQLRGRDLNVDSLATLTDALGNVAGGLDGLVQTLDPKGIAQIGKGLGATADYLDGKVVPGANRAAGRLEQSTAALKADAERLASLVEAAPPDLKAARAAVESLRRFEEGLERMNKVAKVENYQAMREGFKGMEESLTTGSAQVEKFSNLSIPKVTVSGLKVTVEEKTFWPDGKTIAQGMRKAARGAQAAGKEMDAMQKELPKLRTSVEDSRKIVTATRQALAQALARQEKLEPLLRNVPQHAGRLAEELPRMGDDLARVLRDTAKLSEVAGALRQTQKAVDAAASRWPQLRTSLGRSAVVLRTTQKQLRSALANRDKFEQSLRDTVELTRLFSEALPALLDQMEEGLHRQESSLADLGSSIDEATAVLPAASRTATRMLVMTRLLLCLVALMVSLHAAYLLLGAKLGAAYSGG
jgi:flagellar biosynthesis chaperone FliJ